MPGTENIVVDKMQEEFKGCPQALSLNFCSHLSAVSISYDLTLVNKILRTAQKSEGDIQ